jgi:hypothetical protein
MSCQCLEDDRRADARLSDDKNWFLEQSVAAQVERSAVGSSGSRSSATELSISAVAVAIA